LLKDLIGKEAAKVHSARVLSNPTRGSLLSEEVETLNEADMSAARTEPGVTRVDSLTTHYSGETSSAQFTNRTRREKLVHRKCS
jgi:hypothetical protein